MYYYIYIEILIVVTCHLLYHLCITVVLNNFSVGKI